MARSCSLRSGTYSNSVRECRLAVSLLAAVDLPTPLRQSAGIHPARIPDGCEPAVSAGRLQPANTYGAVLRGAFPSARKIMENLPSASRTTALEHWFARHARMAEGVHSTSIMSPSSNPRPPIRAQPPFIWLFGLRLNSERDPGRVSIAPLVTANLNTKLIFEGEPL